MTYPPNPYEPSATPGNPPYSQPPINPGMPAGGAYGPPPGPGFQPPPYGQPPYGPPTGQGYGPPTGYADGRPGFVPPSSPPRSNNGLLRAIIIGASIIVAAALIAFLLPKFINSPKQTAMATATLVPTATPQPTSTPNPTLGLYPFTAHVPGPGCTDNGTSATVRPDWQVALNTQINCGANAIAIVTHIPSSLDNEIFFNGLNGQPLPPHFQTIVYVDISQANNACAGIFLRPTSAGFPSLGFFVCGGQGGYYKVVPYDAHGVPVQANIITGSLAEGNKAQYSLTVQADGTNAYFKLDSNQVAMLPDAVPTGTQQQYVGLGVDTGADNNTGVATDTTLFATFQFTPTS